MVTVPAAITLHTVHVSALAPAAAKDFYSSRYGYTCSLFLFIIPILVIVVWFIPQEKIKISQKSFWWTICLLFPIGAGLDFFFAQYFFIFPNAGATLGIKAPALGRPVPVEEYVFYLTGFICILLLYILFDEYWLKAYNVAGEAAERAAFQRLLHLHWKSVLFGAVAIAGATFYKRFLSDSPAGYPGYFIFFVFVSLVPSSLLLPTVRPLINWRAFSLTAVLIVLISLMWEATLAIPYGWWNFQDRSLIGIRITAWGNLPIEEVFLWMTVSYSTVIIYETIKCWQASGRSIKHALMGT